ncbi:cyclohexanecarboxyl-CoA dehydrogenase [Alcaligenaceae bacterium]|nr:cyclohexanecarboxyl-CoA dehydrogenase [Alcaligenaceae bacterium]
MDFRLSDDQQALIASARRFAVERLAPGYQEGDKSGRVDRSMVKQMGDMGFLGPEFPEAYGGIGVDCVTSGLLLEQIAYGDFNMSYINLLTSLCGQIIAGHAPEHLKEQWLPAILAGEKLVAIALTEPSAGSDAARLTVAAKRNGDCYVLNGEKTSISLADQADVAVVFARSSGQADGARGISAFLVPLDLPGISRSAFDDVGTRAVGRGSIFFDDVRVPLDHMLGQEGQGFVQVMQGFDYSRALIGLQCLGVARASLDAAWEYAKGRETFGQPIIQRQGVSFPLAESETYLESLRWHCLRTLWLKDNNLPHSAEAAMCKWWAPKLACEIIHQCLLTHGHGGYSSDYPFAQRYRDVLGLQIGDGTANIMKMVIAREKSGVRLT